MVDPRSSMDAMVTALLLIPLGLGLLGSLEPGSIGATLIFLRHLEGQNAIRKLAQVVMFIITRAIFIGLMGVVAVAFGTAFLGLQKIAWVRLGAIYVLIGVFYLIGRAGALMMPTGPGLAVVANARGSASLGILFGLNIPACATPLIFGLFAAAAAGASGPVLASGFISLAVFGLALSLPLIAVVLFDIPRRTLDWLAGLSERLPFWTGAVFIGLGLWSLWFGLFVGSKPA
jgi:cytochrome c-type biogenesis protein